jgi:hypothetical protein
MAQEVEVGWMVAQNLGDFLVLTIDYRLWTIDY